ncbi:MAG: bacillithiol biosynthesis cysteine-adding enzyme BshC [Chitinophagaceae bacterium]|nr:bacillithiol biosynthesis cysteine-adding enzyme BshC [Chitinophagaceae bacterium]
MNFTSTQTPYSKTGFFSKMVLDYLGQVKPLLPFYTHPVSVEGIKAAIEDRKKYPTGRELLVEELKKQYQHVIASEKTAQHIGLLLSGNSFTIITAHQPNIFTGHLYFIYKVMHAIKLAEFLKAEIPGCDFVPVFYMGSEDADLEELGHVYINGVKHEWKTDQTGAVGRMKVDKALTSVLDVIAGELSVQPFGKDITGLMKDCYTEGETIEQATFKLVNELFGEYGLVVLLPDNAALKKAFIPVIEKELTEAFSHKLVEQSVAAFPAEYKVQAGGRAINLFYLKDDSRQRIEKSGTQWSIVNGKQQFSEPEIRKEFNEHPDRFSPNVILRPVFQEMILPNIAFIGGGGEIAYWLELKKVFEVVKVPFPPLVLRNSFMLAEEKQGKLAGNLGLSLMDLFKTENDLLNDIVKRNSSVQLSLQKERKAMDTFYTNLKKTAGAVDTSLQRHTEALHKKALDKLEALEKKMLRAEKKKFEAQQRQLHKLKEQLFPHGSLQERIENFMPFYAKWGRGFIDAVYKNSLALEQEFVVMEEK